jgi:DNA invertase Pin-like site-specific DNA recombinase
MSTNTKTVFSYLRFSSPRQEWGDSERRQENLAKDYCDKHGLILSERSFADRGISAWKGANRRGALGELLNLLKAGDCLLIEDNDRLSREDPLTAMNLLHSIVFKGVTVITLRDGNVINSANFFNLSTFLPSIVKSALANEENQKKSMRIKESWITRRKNMAEGTFIGGKIPFWIAKTADGSLSFIEDRAKVIRHIFDLAYGGMGFRSIMHRLASAKVPTFRRNTEWSKGGVSYLLKNIAVYGSIQPYILENKKRVPIGEAIEDYYPAIITKERFLAVQNKVAKRIMYGGGHVGMNVPNLFSGVCRCSSCGGSIIITHKGKKEISYLACSAYHWHHKCTKSIVNYLQVETSLLDYIAKDTKAIQYFSTDTSLQQLQQKIDEKEASLNDLQSTVTRLTDLIEKTEAPEPLVARLRLRMAEHNVLKNEVDSLSGQQYELVNRVSLTSIVADLKRYLQSAGVPVALGPEVIRKLGLNQHAPVIKLDRLQLREAFRNSVASMTADLASKTIAVTWKSGATSAIEMMCKRQGQQKAIYLYRSRTNCNPVSDWISIGAIM